MEQPSKALPVSAVLFGILAGIVGAAVGLLLGLAIGAGLAAAFHVSAMEGAAGYFAGGIALIVALVVTPTSILFTLYWRGVRRIWLLVGLIAVCLSMVAIASAGFGAWYMAQPHILNSNAATPVLEFEIKPLDGQSVESLANAKVELQTDRNTMPGYWHNDSTEHSGVRTGYVEVYFRTSHRVLVLKFSGREDIVFELRLPANPMKPKYRVWSDWQKADFIVKGDEEPARVGHGPGYEVRHRLDYQAR